MSSAEDPSNTTRPLTRITLRSVMPVTCFQFLSTITLLMPVSRISPQIRQISLAIKGASPSVASSRINTSGFVIKDSGISAIIVDKNWKHVTQITDRNVILVKGEVVFEGSSQTLHDDPSVLEQHLGV